MSKKTTVKTALKKNKTKLNNEISSLKKAINDYKVERKANWKEFKTKMNKDIGRLKKIAK